MAAAIERLHADRLVEHVERLAHHARQGEVWDKAVRYLRQAGTKVFLRSAHREAATYFEQALDALRRLPEHPDAIAESLDIRFDLRNALLPLGELGRMGALLDEAEALAEAVGDQRRLGRALNYKVIQFGWPAISRRRSRPDFAPWPSASRRRTSPSRWSPTGILAWRTWRGASAARPSGTARPRSR